MEMQKAKYEAPELDELQLNSFAVIAAGASKIEDVPGDEEENPLDI